MASSNLLGDRPAKSASLAIVLSWFVPGAGHLYLGRIAFGLISLGLVSGLYALGLYLSGGMTFAFLDPELRLAFAFFGIQFPLGPSLVPEAGNLSGLMYQMRTYGYGPSQPQPWPEHIMLGSLLCALSGIANVCLAAHASYEARLLGKRPAPGADKLPPALGAFLAWACPGLGHYVQGRRLRAAIVGALLLGLLALGTWLAEGSNLSRERHFYYWGGQFLAGLPSIALEWISGRPPVTHEIRYADVGLLLGCLAGLLNVLAMLDVYAWSEARALGLDPRLTRSAHEKQRKSKSKEAAA